MKKYDFEYCMKNDCNRCKRQRECDVSEYKKKNKDFNERTEKKRKKHHSN